jgi:hypothetical protein
VAGAGWSLLSKNCGVARLRPCRDLRARPRRGLAIRRSPPSKTTIAAPDRRRDGPALEPRLYGACTGEGGKRLCRLRRSLGDKERRRDQAEAPAVLSRLDQDPAVRQRVLEKMRVDAQSGAPVNQAVQSAREIYATGWSACAGLGRPGRWLCRRGWLRWGRGEGRLNPPTPCDMAFQKASSSSAV